MDVPFKGIQYIWINVKYYWQTRQFDIGNPYPDPKVLCMILSWRAGDRTQNHLDLPGNDVTSDT